MGNKKNGQCIKNNRCCKRRLKSPRVRDPNGSISTFRQFYQSGGRDCEQYSLWLQTLANSSVDSEKIKKEPIDNEFNVVNLLPSVHLQQPLPTPRIAGTHPLLKPMRRASVPSNSPPSSQMITTSFEPQIRLFCDHSLPIAPLLINWSVTDVGRFIEKHFLKKNLARKFIEQKIDGHALSLLTEDHLIKIFKMKLGPALHLLTLISTIKK